MEQHSHNRSLGPIEMVVLQGTSFCNMNCDYCYLSQKSRRNRASMDIGIIRVVFEKILTSPLIKSGMRVSWHSGEPLVLRQSYYREAIEIILKIANEKCGSDFIITFDMQTNATLINQQWCDFFREYEDIFTLGVSCDGPDFLHDIHRKNWSGKPTHSLTHRGMKLLSDNNISFDVSAVVSPDGLKYPAELLGYFGQFSSHIREFHFNLHDEFFINNDEAIRVYAAQYEVFLQGLLREISGNKINSLSSIRNFSMFYKRIFSEDESVYDARDMSKPFKTLSIETNGDLTTFYAGLTVDECGDLKDLYGDNKGLVIGNILSQSFDDIIHSEKLKSIRTDFELSHSKCESDCEYYSLCSGGYNLTKYRRFKTFDVAETPECFVHVKTFSQTMLTDINSHVEPETKAVTPLNKGGKKTEYIRVVSVN